MRDAPRQGFKPRDQGGEEQSKTRRSHSAGIDPMCGVVLQTHHPFLPCVQSGRRAVCSAENWRSRLLRQRGLAAKWSSWMNKVARDADKPEASQRARSAEVWNQVTSRACSPNARRPPSPGISLARTGRGRCRAARALSVGRSSSTPTRRSTPLTSKVQHTHTHTCTHICTHIRGGL